MIFREIAKKVAIDLFSKIKLFDENTAFGHMTEVPNINLLKFEPKIPN